MAIDPEEITFAQNGRVLVAPLGSTGPTTATASLDAAFVDLGYVDEDGVTVTPGVDTNPIKAWQSAAPVAYGLNEATFEVSFTLLQTNADTTSQYFSGETWVMGASGNATLTLSSNPTIEQLMCALVVEYTDNNGETLRYYVARAMLTDRQELTHTMADPVKYGMTYSATDASGVLGVILTNKTDIYSS